MRERLLKEIRMIQPAWIVVMLSLVAVSLLTRTDNDGPWLYITCWFGCSLLGAVPYGQEYSNQTLSLLVAQPISRRRLWYEKMVVLGIALVTVTIFTLLLGLMSQDLHRGVLEDPVRVGFHLATLAFGSFLWTFGASPCLSLLLKNSIATVILAPLLPLALCGLLWLMGDSLMRENLSALSGNGVALQFFVLPIIAYSAIMYLLGCLRFQKLQAIDSLAKDFSLPAWFKVPFARYSPLNWSCFAGAYASLIKKELHLHKINYLLAILLCLGCASMVVVKWLRPATSEWVYNVPFIIYWCVLPFTIGAVTVAEERNFGLLEWHLVLPPSRLKQWLLKVGTTYFVLLILGVFVPMLLVWADRNTFRIYEFTDAISVVVCVRVAAPLIVATGVVIFASSFSSNSIRAILGSAGMGAAVVLLMPLVSVLMLNASHQTERFQVPFVQVFEWFPMLCVQAFAYISQLFSLSESETRKLILLGLKTFIGIAFGSILWFAYMNFRRSESGRLRPWVQSSLVVGATCIIVAGSIIHKVLR